MRFLHGLGGKCICVSPCHWGKGKRWCKHACRWGAGSVKVSATLGVRRQGRLLQEVSYKSVPQALTSVPQECPSKLRNKSVLQGCLLRLDFAFLVERVCSRGSWVQSGFLWKNAESVNPLVLNPSKQIVFTLPFQCAQLHARFVLWDLAPLTLMAVERDREKTCSSTGIPSVNWKTAQPTFGVLLFWTLSLLLIC